VPEPPEAKRQRELIEETGRELKELIRKINSRAKEAEREDRPDDSPRRSFKFGFWL
jgi:hypothetical protein